MKRVNGRSLLTYVIVVAVGVFLLLLVSPSLGDFMPFGVFVSVASLLPLIALVAIVVYLMGSSKQPTSEAKLLKHQTAKYTAKAIVLSTLLSVVVTYASARQPAYQPHTLRYVFENIGVGLLFVGFALTLLLVNAQKFVYWPFWNRNDKMNSDERQKAVRQRVFEKAYRWNLLILPVAAVLSQNSSQRIRHQIIQVVVLCLLGMPAIIAAWQKDS